MERDSYKDEIIKKLEEENEKLKYWLRISSSISTSLIMAFIIALILTFGGFL